MSGPRLGAVILAMEPTPRLEGFGPLLPLRGSTVLGLMARTLRRAGIEDMMALAGPQALEVHAEAARLAIGCATGLQPGPDLAGRMGAAFRLLPQDLDGVLFLPADHPLVRPQTILALAGGLGGRPVIFPTFRGERGQPCLVAAGCLHSLADWTRERGLYPALAALEALHGVEEIPVPDGNVLFRLETPEDFREAMRRVRRPERPSVEEALAFFELQASDGRALAHAQMVARAALALARALSQARGWPMDLPFVQAAALLTALRSRNGKTPSKRAALLDRAGFSDAARVVEFSHVLPLDPSSPLTEREVAALADKLILHGAPAGLIRRYAEKMQRYGRDEASRQAIAGRRDRALALKQRLEAEAGRDLRDILADAGLSFPREDLPD